jgi:hypothetical protein
VCESIPQPLFNCKKNSEKLPVSYRVPPQAADRGIPTRYGGYRGNKIPKLPLQPYSLILIYQGLEEENLNQKSPGPPGWVLMQWASSSLIVKNTKLLQNQTPRLGNQTEMNDSS